MPRVLVIDDQPHVRATISAALQAQGFEVVALGGGRLGLLELDKSRFDLAVIDIFMPEMDGVKLIRAMRERVPTLPVIAMSGAFLRTTGRPVLDVLSNAPDLSDVAFLQKPFRAKELLGAIRTAIGVAA